MDVLDYILNMKIFDCAYLRVEKGCLCYEGIISKDEDGYYLDLKEVTGWGVDIDDKLSEDEVIDFFEGYILLDWVIE